MENYYKALGLDDFCTDQDKIKNAYRSQIKYFHPDLGNVSQELAEAKTKQLNVAYETLSDPQRKQIYDSQLRYEQSGNTQSNSYNNNYYRNTSTGNTYTYNSNTYRANTNSNSSYRGSNYSYTQRKSTGPKYWPWIIAFLFLLAMCSSGGTSSSSSSYTGSTNTSNNTTTVKDADSDLTPVSVSNGKIFKQSSAESNCKFTVETSGSNGYYIYLKDTSSSGKNDTSFYVKGGNTVSVMVPEGTYKLYYASGTTWYGTTHKFGSKTSYTTSDDKFVFSHEIKGDYIYYDGWTVTLYPVTNGNMETESIGEGQFPG